MNGVKYFFAISMQVVFFYYLNLLVPNRIWMGILGLALVVGSSYFGAFEKVDFNNKWTAIRKGLFLALFFVGLGYGVVALFNLGPLIQTRMIEEKMSPAEVVSWLEYSDENLQKALKEKKSVLIDFRADWCAACLEMEQHTFNSERFKVLSSAFVLLRFDATKDSPALEALRAKYEIVGLPTMIFYTKSGELRKDLTVTEFQNIDEFAEKMIKASN